MLPTPEDFLWMTSIKNKACPRSAALKKVDVALQVWQERKDGNLETQIQALYLVIKRSGGYLRKDEKKSYFGLTNTQNTTLQLNRKDKAEQVLTAAQELLRELAPHTLRGFQYMEQRNQRHKNEIKKLNFNRYTRKQLEPGYDRERMQWEEHGKRFMPHSGTFVDRARDYLDRYGGIQFINSPEGKSIREVLKTDFTKLTLEQYERLGGMDQGLERGGVVNFYNKIGRVEFLAIPNGRGGFEDIRGVDISMDDYTGYGVADFHMYALDHHGNLLTARGVGLEMHQNNYWQRGRFFNHSSFNAGREVICAGTIWIRDGKLKHIDNFSGHYKPTWDNLVEAVSFMRDDGIDLSETRVIDRSGKPPHNEQPYLALSILNKTFEPYPEAMKDLYRMPDL